jgi:hypothetical protein
MKCPVCKSDLNRGKDLHLETLDEHILQPNNKPSLKASYHCINTKCYEYTHDVVWDEYGDRYGGYRGMDDYIPWIDNNDAPFGSIQRKINVEVYKDDENFLLCTIPIWPLKGWQIRVKFFYKSDEDGTILKRNRKFEWIRPDGCYHIWGLNMLIYSCKKSFNDWKIVRKDPHNDWAREELENAIKRGSCKNAEWWRKASSKFTGMLIKFL